MQKVNGGMKRRRSGSGRSGSSAISSRWHHGIMVSAWQWRLASATHRGINGMSENQQAKINIINQQRQISAAWRSVA